MDKVVAGTTAYLTVDFKDKDGEPAIPSTVSYKVDNLGTGAVIRASTSATPSSSVEIVLAADVDTASPGPDFTYDVRRVTVTGTYGSTAQVVDYYDFQVINPERA